jgi:hypothetical protein
MSACLKCGSEKVIQGRLRGSSKSWPAVFRPKSMRWFNLSLYGGVFTDGKSFACLDCGLVWTSAAPHELRMFVKNHCKET